MSDALARLTSALETRYRIARQIGIGGMATVYLAHDLRHERDVAIKVLHPDLAAALGAERFLAEIKTTAKLQHPHILPLLDSGEADGLLYYVMPYVAGESLRSRLERETQLAVDDAVRIAREVLSALESAHRQGVVHRDIKPENILLHEEQALVADFGIALAVSAAGGPRMTQTGLSLGTPAYMAPEQAMGERAIDGRADIYALGAVLYEMLVGEAPFTGPTVQAIVARVMTESPRPLTGQRRSVPANVNAAVLRALEKLPADRFHSAAEFSSALVTPGVQTQPAADTQAVATPGIFRTVVRHPALPWALALIVAVAAVTIALRGNPAGDARPLHLAVDLPAGMELPPHEIEILGISDDGANVALGGIINGSPQVALRSLAGNDFRLVEGSAGASSGSAAFSSDGRWLAFGADNKIFKTRVSGGPPTPIAESRWAQMAWIGNEAIIYTKNYDGGLNRISSEGRDSATLTTPDRKKGELGHWWPQVLPDGDHVLFTNYTTPAERSKLEVISLRSGKREVVLEGGYFGRYAAGHLLFVRNDAVVSVPFDPRSRRVKGSPVPLPLSIETDAPNGWAGFTMARNGTFVYLTDALRDIAVEWTDEGGNEEPAIDSTGRYSEASPSPDGRSIALVRDGDLWVFDRQRKLFSRLTRTEQRERSLVWTPDSKEILYARDVPQYDVFKRRADGSRAEEIVLTSPNDKHPRSISRDGKILIFEEDSPGGNDLFAGSPNAGDRTRPRGIIEAAGSQEFARFSPDGLWIVYQSDESGRPEVYLAPFPADRGPVRQQLSDGGGSGPEWGPDGRTIYYGWSGRIRRIRVDPRTGEIGRPEVLNRIQPYLGWTLAPDGRFLMLRGSKASERHSMKLILNAGSMLDAGGTDD
jgi:Tol biopolymer transport system component